MRPSMWYKDLHLPKARTAPPHHPSNHPSCRRIMHDTTSTWYTRNALTTFLVVTVVGQVYVVSKDGELFIWMMMGGLSLDFTCVSEGCQFNKTDQEVLYVHSCWSSRKTLGFPFGTMKDWHKKSDVEFFLPTEEPPLHPSNISPSSVLLDDWWMGRGSMLLFSFQ